MISTALNSRAANFFNEVAGQQRDIVQPPPQGHVQRDHDQPMVEVLAKSAVIHLLREIAVWGSYDPDIDADRIRTAQSRKLALLQNTQELGLEIEQQISNLIQKERSAVGLLETPTRSRTRMWPRPRSN
jgi:hypothetical protein